MPKMKECQPEKGPFPKPHVHRTQPAIFLRAGSSFSGELRSGFWTLTWIILLKFRILVKLQKLKFRQDLLVFSFQPVPLEKLPKNLVSTKHPSVQKNLCHATRTLKILSKKKLEEKKLQSYKN